jgi:signal transduction histidine kinase
MKSASQAFAERLVESFLSLARAQHGAASDLATVSLAALTAGALDTHAAAAASGGLSVRHHADGEADIAGSRTLLAQMVGNIIDNAVRRSGATVDEIAELLGHYRLSSSDAYLHPADQRLREAVDRVAAPARLLAGDR